ncbi:MAG: methyltetrahydrofolate cobalamin methyltransferase [Christensenella sp.]|nr:methyltetrahydrofolate cobalamin methyltransferase [Christensenella sp.]
MIIIGEKLNGFIPSVGKAIHARDEAFLRDLAKRQEEAGANYLDVCAAVDSEIESETLRWLVELAQSASNLPLCIDSPNPQVLAEVLPYCKKEGIVNSVSMEAGKIETLFPLIANTSWKVVALLCSNSGVPQFAEERVAIFNQILLAAKSYGISESRLLIDPIVHTLSTDERSFSTFAECARAIRSRSSAVHIVSGLSNISFGLPARPVINHAFLVLAMQAGMDGAIVDVLDREMVGLLHATRALLGKDEYCMDYIGAFREGRFGTAKS